MAKKLDYKIYTELDFDKNKEKLKEYLKNQDEFKDFDFEGSAINIILNLLSQNGDISTIGNTEGVDPIFG